MLLTLAPEPIESPFLIKLQMLNNEVSPLQIDLNLLFADIYITYRLRVVS